MPRAVFAALPPGSVRNEGSSREEGLDLVMIHEMHGPRLLPETPQKVVVHVRMNVHQGVFYPEYGIQR